VNLWKRTRDGKNEGSWKKALKEKGKRQSDIVRKWPYRKGKKREEKIKGLEKLQKRFVN